MLTVLFMKPKPGAAMEERIAHRLDWKTPPGIKKIAEYWLAGEDPAVVAVAECDDATLFFQIQREWSDLFECTWYPCITAEEGIAATRKQLAVAHA